MMQTVMHESNPRWENQRNPNKLKTEQTIINRVLASSTQDKLELACMIKVNKQRSEQF